MAARQKNGRHMMLMTMRMMNAYSSATGLLEDRLQQRGGSVINGIKGEGGRVTNRIKGEGGKVVNGIAEAVGK